MKNLIEDIKNFLEDEQILQDELMSNHTTFKIGGKVDIMLLPKNIEQIKKCLEYCEKNNINYYVMGNGSNLLVSDNGFRGIIIKIFKSNSICHLSPSKLASCYNNQKYPRPIPNRFIWHFGHGNYRTFPRLLTFLFNFADCFL